MADESGILRTTALHPELSFVDWLQTGPVVAVVVFALVLTSTQNLMHSFNEHIVQPSFHRIHHGPDSADSNIRLLKFIVNLVITAALFYVAYLVSRKTVRSRRFLKDWGVATGPPQPPPPIPPPRS